MKESSTAEARVKVLQKEVFHKGWSSLIRYTYEYELPNGEVQKQQREAYDRGNGITVLLYNPVKKTVVLTEQFRLPTYLNGNPSGLMIEACAGKLEAEDPALGMIREIEEETGHKVSEVEKVFEAYMSPGTITELIHFFVAKVSEKTKISAGGGLASEQENIKVLEISFDDAISRVEKGEIKDAKTIMLLQYARLKNIL